MDLSEADEQAFLPSEDIVEEYSENEAVNTVEGGRDWLAWLVVRLWNSRLIASLFRFK